MKNKEKKWKKENKRKKSNILALFQFTAFVALILTLLTMVLIGYIIFFEHDASGKPAIFTAEKWMEGIGNVLKFESISAIVFPAGVLLYTAFGLYILSWYVGSRIFYCDNRTLFDSLFLVFMMIPILGNLFALIAQFVEKEFFIAEVKIDKEAIVLDQTRLIEVEIKKERQKINRRKKTLEKIKEEKKVEAKLKREKHLKMFRIQKSEAKKAKEKKTKAKEAVKKLRNKKKK